MAAPGRRPNPTPGAPPIEGPTDGNGVSPRDGDLQTTFTSLLPGIDAEGAATPPDTLADLHLDVVIAAMTTREEEPDYLADLFRRPVKRMEAVSARQAVFADLQDARVREVFDTFGRRMQRVRRRMVTVAKTEVRNSREGQLLDAAAMYCDAISELHETTTALSDSISSPGLRSFLAFLDDYMVGAGFRDLAHETTEMKAALGTIDYCVQVHGLRVEVSRYDDEDDYSHQVEAVFHRFKQSEPTSYLRSYRAWPALGHVGAYILQCVERLFPETFAELHRYCERHRDFLHPDVRRFERELQFFLAYSTYLAPLRARGLCFCLPQMSSASKRERAVDTFDLALAAKLTGDGQEVVTNDYHLDGVERLVVVSGPNQGGKTTFARTFGQLHHLASLGCPVPGVDCRLLLCDGVFTHFQREEGPSAETGKLEDDLRRVGAIFAAATTNSVVVMNEPFSSTSLADARFLGQKALTKMVELDLLAVYVTFVDELARLGPAVVSMVSSVDPDDPAIRTYKVVRAPADGLAHALALARRRKVTYEQLTRRLRP
ncbi:MAG: MutS-related protein [Acidimicrobiales bacterium]